jgi:hypothetical protein
LYLGVGIAGAAMILALAFVRIPKDERDGWDEDELEVEVDDGRPAAGTRQEDKALS